MSAWQRIIAAAITAFVSVLLVNASPALAQLQPTDSSQVAHIVLFTATDPYQGGGGV